MGEAFPLLLAFFFFVFFFLLFLVVRLQHLLLFPPFFFFFFCLLLRETRVSFLSPPRSRISTSTCSFVQCLGLSRAQRTRSPLFGATFFLTSFQSPATRPFFFPLVLVPPPPFLPSLSACEDEFFFSFPNSDEYLLLLRQSVRRDFHTCPSRSFFSPHRVSLLFRLRLRRPVSLRRRSRLLASSLADFA